MAIRGLVLLLALLSAGCASPSDASDAQQPPAVPAAGWTEQVAWDGQIDETVCVANPISPGSCLAPLSITHENAWGQRLPGELAHATFDLSWEAATPASEVLRASILCDSKNESACPAWEVLQTEGGSPLHVELAQPIGAHAVLYLVVSPWNPMQPYGQESQVGDGTMVHMDGVLTYSGAR